MKMNSTCKDPRVKISDITTEGFTVVCPFGSYHITRKRYPWFKDATDEELHDVFFVDDRTDDEHGNMLVWRTIGIDFDEESIARPELIYNAILVRGKKRRDLFVGYEKGVVVE